MAASTLDAFLASYERAGGGLRNATVEVVRALAGAALKVRRAINSGAFGAGRSQSRGSTNSDGDLQQDLDIYADEIFLDAARHAPVAWYASEELATPVLLDAGARLALAIDPLDGSSNIDANVSIGTIFSLLPGNRRAGCRSGRLLSAAGTPAACGRLLHLRTAVRADADARRGHALLRLLLAHRRIRAGA